MKYIKKFNNYSEVNERWYHNLLAGLMLLSPTLSTYANNNSSIPSNKSQIEMSSEENTLTAINTLLDKLKTNPEEFENAKQMIFQLEKLLSKYENGEMDIATMNKIATDFFRNAQDMEKPVLFTRGSEKVGYKKMGEIKTYETLIEQEKPSEIYVDLYEETFFESGSYKSSNNSDILKNVTDTITSIEGKGYRLEGVIIESSTDGENLSNNLKSSLEKDGYNGDNSGLSEARNDELKRIMVSDIGIDSNQVAQNIKWSDDGEKNDDLRYNKITLKLAKTEAGEITKTVKENVVTVYYKVIDADAKKDKINRKSKPNKMKRKGAKIKVSKDRHNKCYFF